MHERGRGVCFSSLLTEVRCFHRPGEKPLARVAELVDALASGASVLTDVGVQVPPRARWAVCKTARERFVRFPGYGPGGLGRGLRGLFVWPRRAGGGSSCAYRDEGAACRGRVDTGRPPGACFRAGFRGVFVSTLSRGGDGGVRRCRASLEVTLLVADTRGRTHRPE